MSPAKSIVLIDFHRLLNVSIQDPRGTTSLWVKVKENIESFYAASCTAGRAHSRPSIQFATNAGRELVSVKDNGDEGQVIESLRMSLSTTICEHVPSVKDRLQTAIQAAVSDIVDDNKYSQHVRGNILLILVAKHAEEKDYEFADDAEDQRFAKLDLRATMYKVMRNLRLTATSHINIDVIRLFHNVLPNDSRDLQNEKILPNLSVSVRNAFVGDDSLEIYMRACSKRYYDLDKLVITNIGHEPINMASDSMQLLFAHQNAHLPVTAGKGDLQLQFVQMVRKDGIDLPRCRCLHPVSVYSLCGISILKQELDNHSKKLLGRVSNNFLILLHDRHSGHKSLHYTHALAQYNKSVHLLCFDRSIDQDFQNAKSEALELVEIKTEGWSKPTGSDKRNPQASASFFTEIIAPNTVQSLHEIRQLVHYSPHRYSLRNTSALNVDTCTGLSTARTTEKIERISRWWLSFADSFGRDITTSSEIKSLTNYSDAFELTNNLTGDILDLIRQELVAPGSSNNTFGDRLVPLLFEQLTQAELAGVHGTLFSKRIAKSAVRMLSKKIITALDIASRRFLNADKLVSPICQQIQQCIQKYQDANVDNGSKDVDMMPKEEKSSVDSAWTQINRYQNMTLREKEESLAPEAKIVHKAEPVAFSHQLPVGVLPQRGRGRGGIRGKSGAARNVGNTAVNPLFYPDKYAEQEKAKIAYPDIRVARPWLEVSKPNPSAVELSRKRTDEQLGDPTSLLRAYWKAEERRHVGCGTSQNDGMLWVTDKKTHVRKRVRKEFDGRLAESHVPGGRQQDQMNIADMLPM